MRTIKASRRFGLDKNRCVIDKLNPENNGKVHCLENEREDDAHLRTLLLYPRLWQPFSRLFVNKRPKDFNEDKHSLECVIISTIKASHLNGVDPLLSTQHPFDGKLKRRKEGIRSFTSISLFVDDVERVLRDLYGDIDSDDLDDLLAAVREIVEQFARYLRPDLKSEDDDAETIDLRVGIIQCTADPAKVDKRTRSKWSRALRYALAYKSCSEPLDQFIKSKGGINDCAARLRRRLGPKIGTGSLIS